MNELERFVVEDDAIGVVEIVLILLVLVGLVVLFKDQITEIMNNAFKSVNKAVKNLDK